MEYAMMLTSMFGYNIVGQKKIGDTDYYFK